jgi:hypothetical protein
MESLDGGLQGAEGVGIRGAGAVDERIQFVALLAVSLNGWVALRRVHKIIPFLWVEARVVQEAMDQLGGLCGVQMCHGMIP